MEANEPVKDDETMLIEWFGSCSKSTDFWQDINFKELYEVEVIL